MSSCGFSRGKPPPKTMDMEVSRAVKRHLNYTHQALIDAMIARPDITLRELGAMFNRSETWISLIRSSDLFREKLRAREAEMVDPLLKATVAERFELITARSTEILIEKLMKPADEVPDNLVLAAAALGAKAEGRGGFSNKPTVQINAPDPARIERLAERLESLNRRTSTEIIDVQAVSLPRETGAK